MSPLAGIKTIKHKLLEILLHLFIHSKSHLKLLCLLCGQLKTVNRAGQRTRRTCKWGTWLYHQAKPAANDRIIWGEACVDKISHTLRNLTPKLTWQQVVEVAVVESIIKKADEPQRHGLTLVDKGIWIKGIWQNLFQEFFTLYPIIEFWGFWYIHK